MVAYCKDGKALGLISFSQNRTEPNLFMEIINEGEDIAEQLKCLSDLRAKYGIAKFIAENKIHVEIFDMLFGGEGSTG